MAGSSWRGWDGALAVSSLKDESLRLLRLTKKGTLREEWKPDALNERYGRLRAAVAGPDGSLYLTTSNGSNDKILRVTAR